MAKFCVLWRDAAFAISSLINTGIFLTQVENLPSYPTIVTKINENIMPFYTTKLKCERYAARDGTELNSNKEQNL